MPDEWRDLANLMVHNHVIDRTFSTGDLIASKNFDLGISIVVTPSYNFYLFRPTKGWPEGNEWIEEYSILIKKIQQSRRHNCNWATASHLALDELANHYGIIYRVTDLHGNSIPKEELKVSWIAAHHLKPLNHIDYRPALAGLFLLINPVRSGHVNLADVNQFLGFLGQNGNLWTSISGNYISATSANSYYPTFWPTSVSATDRPNNRYLGFPVRCLIYYLWE